VIEPQILHGDARALPLPDASVDLIVTSPPYFGLRDYGHPDQLGAETTPVEYIAALVECTREMVRVLKPSGSIFVNLGDKYGPHKSLRLLPERYRIACVDELGLIARAVLVWSKPNGLPESVMDRVRRSHEDWVHLTKSPRYFAAVDEIREPTQGRVTAMTWEQRKARGDAMRQGEQRDTFGLGGMTPNPLGKLPGSVWEIATQPLRVPAELGVDHFAAFPMEWPRRLILGWSPREVCTACGDGRRPVKNGAWYFAEPTNDQARRAMARAVEAGLTAAEVAEAYGIKALGSSNVADAEYVQRNRDLGERLGGSWSYAKELRSLVKRERSGYACACPDTTAPATPGVVLDPFGGTGTSALVAAMHGRQGISVDASGDYCRLAEWRCSDPKQRERAARPAAARPARKGSVSPPPMGIGIDLGVTASAESVHGVAAITAGATPEVIDDHGSAERAPSFGVRDDVLGHDVSLSAGRPVRVAVARPHHDAPAVSAAVLPEGAEAARAGDVLGEQSVDGRRVSTLAVGQVGGLQLGVSGEPGLRHESIVQPAGQSVQPPDVA
jgi:DNA modification methylase